MYFSAVGSAALSPTAPPVIPSQIQNYVARLRLATSWAPKSMQEA